MEPASIDTPQSKTARTGSLENPEIVENVPGHVIPILEREFDDFDTESTRFLKGDVEEDTFIKFRLKQGVYGQRQPDVQMVRVKLPMGGVTPDQLDTFATGIEKYVPLRKGHITTRQNIQMHHVPLPDAASLIRELGDAGLSSREGCGNTMRNVTGDPRAGTLDGELFDITPYAGAYVRYFVRHPTTQAMPRKVKTARARIKVLIDKIGIDAFREQVEEELKGDWVNDRDFSLEGIFYDIDEAAGAPTKRDAYATPNGDSADFDHFLTSNVWAQRQGGFSTVEVKVDRGDLSPDQLRGLGQIMREYSGGYARTTVHQN